MITPLPEKIRITGPDIDPTNLKKSGKDKLTGDLELYVVEPSDLVASARSKYDAHYLEKTRRKDPSQDGVAQEALDCLEELKAQGRSTEELWTVYGYSPVNVVKEAQKEEQRIIRELHEKPSKDVEQNPKVKLVVADVKTKHNIPEKVVEPAEPVAFGPEME